MRGRRRPRAIPFGLKMVAPVIMAFGSKAQQQRFLPKILAAEEWWCQGYSEPGSGSDLASVKTRAERIRADDGEFYVVNGQKTWTTLGQYADWIFCLVRTDPAAKAQRGISFLLIDMKTPGVTVRPIITMDGAHEVNEVWFENVRVPAANLIGEENGGWTYAKFLLGHERTNIAGIGIAKRELARLKRIAAQETKNGAAAVARPAVRGAHRPGRNRPDRAGNHQPARAVGRSRTARAGPGSLDPEDQGHRNPAGDHRTAGAGGRPVRAAAAARSDGRRL